MEKVNISNDLSITNICFGTSALGNMPETYGYEVDPSEAEETIQAIFQSPINFMDTSRNYGMGRSEQLIGNVLKKIGGKPTNFVLATKIDRDMTTDVLDADVTRRSFDESIQALGTDQIDILHLHDPEHCKDVKDITKPGGALDALFKIKDEGLVNLVGLAMGDIDLMEKIIPNWPFDVLINHNRYTLLNRQADKLFDLAHEKGIKIFNAAPFCGGILAKGTSKTKKLVYQNVPEKALLPIVEIEKICNQFDIPLGAAALQFSIRDKRISSTIIGITKTERIIQTMEWATIPIPQEAWNKLLSLPYSTENPEAGRAYKLE
jgi:D-threo-aldose 1-dehydrogenase